MAITTSVYGGGPFYPGEGSALPGLNECGFTTLVCWAVHVQANGDLVYNDTPIVTKGQYVGDPNWGSLLKAAKTGGTVNRILFSIGGWGTSDFANIQALMTEFGTGSDNPLYQSFSALKSAIGVIDGIDLDNEDNYDVASTIQFCQMIGDIGYQEVTFCPYTNMTYWAQCLEGVEKSHQGLVTGYNLQCYAGGAGNPSQFNQWIASINGILGDRSAEFISPGLWCKNGTGCEGGQSPAEIEQAFSSWKSYGFTGGFIWLYDDIVKCGPNPQSYAKAINLGLQ